MEELLEEAFEERTKQRDPIYALNKYLNPHFPKQNEFVRDRSRYITAQCSRRAGKSNGLGLRFLHTLETHPGCFCPYIALSRESARNIMWPVLQELCSKLGIACEFTEYNLTMTHPNGSRLQLFGADMKNFIRRLKGTKSPGAAIDESQDFGSHLQSLIDDVLTPTLADYEDSWLAVVGTPGPVPKGYFYEITAEKRHGYSFHEWTLFENPYLPNARQFVSQLKQKRSWEDDHATLRREWYNQWVLDVQSLLIQWKERLNDYQALPPSNYNYILGIDIGHRDADALALLAWSESSPNIYLIEERLTRQQDISELSLQIESMMSRYDISKIVIDEGGLGKKCAEEIRRRKYIPVQAADKVRKMENVAFLNDWLRLGKFKAKKESRFVKDSYEVQIDWDKSTPDKIRVKNSFHSDIIDAVLYAFKESPAFTYQEAQVKPRHGSDAWATAEVSDMEEKALQHFTELEDATKGFGAEWA